MSTQNRKGVTVIEVAVVLVLLVILGGAVALPAIQNAREAARRSSCKCRLCGVSMGLQNYHEIHKTFPPGWVAVSGPTAGPPERSAYGWVTFILPFIDQGPLAKTIDLNADDPSFQAQAQRSPHQFAHTSLSNFRCPSDDGQSQDQTSSVAVMATSNYVGNFGVGLPLLAHESQMMQGVFGSNSNTRIADCRDGLSNIVLVGERRLPLSGSMWPESRIEGPFNSYWAGIPRGASPLAIVATATDGDITESDSAEASLNQIGPLNGRHRVPPQVRELLVNKTIDGQSLSSRGLPGKTVSGGLSSHHPGGTHIMFGDGSSRFISDGVDPNTWINLMRRADGQKLGEF